MAGHRPFREIQARRGPLTPERLAVQRAYEQALAYAEWLFALREKSLPPEEVADARVASQARIVQATPRADRYLAALAAAIESLGGRLELTAAFPDQSVELALPIAVGKEWDTDIPQVVEKVATEKLPIQEYTMDQLLDRITVDPAVCHGKPCIRGLRYPVETVLEWLSAGMTFDEILADYPDLERDDLRAALAYAASR